MSIQTTKYIGELWVRSNMPQREQLKNLHQDIYYEVFGTDGYMKLTRICNVREIVSLPPIEVLDGPGHAWLCNSCPGSSGPCKFTTPSPPSYIKIQPPARCPWVSCPGKVKWEEIVPAKEEENVTIPRWLYNYLLKPNVHRVPPEWSSSNKLTGKV